MLMAVASIGVNAQNTRSGYFVDDYLYRFQMNPAYGNSARFTSFPALGNLNVAVEGNIGVNNLLYKRDGKTVTLFDSRVSPSTAMGNLHNMSKLQSDIKLNIFTKGFKMCGGYATINLGVRSNLGVNIPKSLFSVMKEGISNRTYSIKNMGMFADVYGEFGLGYSHDVTDQIRVGANLKFLVGLASVRARFKDAQLELGRDSWNIKSEADVRLSVKGAELIEKYDHKTDSYYVDNIDFDSFGVNGYGMALDMGVIYQPLRDWRFSLAVLDFGFIHYGSSAMASTNGVKRFTTNDYLFDFNDEDGFNSTIDKMGDDIAKLYQLEKDGNGKGSTHMLGATMNVGAEYILPVYRKLTFGLLNTTRIQGPWSWTDFRLSANIAPVKCLDGSVNIAYGTFGFSFGWLLNLHWKGFSLFAGMDRTPTSLTSQFIPVHSKVSVNFGLNLPF